MKLIADVIEGDRVYLENTEAAVVRGKEVIIGPGCSIGTIEYENKYECDPHSQIKEKQNCKTLFCYTKRVLFQEHPFLFFSRLAFVSCGKN